MHKILATAALLWSVSAAAEAQVFNDPNPYARSQQDRMERLRQQNDRLADYAQQYRTQTRLSLLELRARRQPEPNVPLVEIASNPDRAVPGADTAPVRSEAVSDGADQINSWLDRDPR